MTPADHDAAADAEALGRLREAHVAAVNRGDLNGWIGLFAEDGVQMPPQSRANVGRPAIKEWSRGFLSSFRVEFALFVDEVQVTGDWAFERGAYRIIRAPKGGGMPHQDVGKYITIYQRQAGGAWAIARSIWNTDQPPPIAMR
ncbi:MAG TPA: SgcJ/EcaC family oxidoreductase [Phycisphaerae bacterium]|jgi:uncharacterized protein (TIGR02246 family)